MKKQVGIITIYDLSNYGNRLQNYAVTKVFEKRGFECTTVIINHESRMKYILKIFVEKFLHLGFSKKLLDMQRKTAFLTFSRKYIISDYIWDGDRRKKEKWFKQKDYYVIGSDQVWNPNFAATRKENFLYGVDRVKKICFSPSFGVSDIPKQREADFKKWLQEFNYISVREDAGAKLVNRLVGKDAEVLIDPTLMLTRHEWLEVSESISKPNREYILCCVLGEKSEVFENAVNRLTADNRVEIIFLCDKQSRAYYTASPGQFIDLISHAKIVLTDSFHVTVFSILFEKPFVVFPRAGVHQDMQSRIDTLLRVLKLENRKEMNVDWNNIFEIDFNECNKLLDIERRKATSFIDCCLGIS